MKRQYVIPDLLASMTADALFGVGAHLHPDEAAARAQADADQAAVRTARGGRLSRWIAHRRLSRVARSAAASPATSNLTPKEPT